MKSDVSGPTPAGWWFFGSSFQLSMYFMELSSYVVMMQDYYLALRDAISLIEERGANNSIVR